ncbi:MAG: LLM class flavin-dependent oxidoreductase [Alphaproteobacteria bacterium]
MQFGLNFFPSVGPSEMSAEQYWQEALSLAELADSLGYTHIRTVEHYFEPYGGYSPNPLLFLASAAQRTKHMRLISGAVLPVFNHPLKLAGEIAMLDALSRGRLDVGFARAFLPHEFDRFGRKLDESRARFDEGVRQIRLLLTQENVSDDGTFHKIKNVTSLPRPTQLPTPPMWIASFATPESFAAAGKAGMSMMAIPLSGGKMNDLIGLYRENWRSAGHPGNGRVMLSFSMCCMPNREDAIAAFRAPMNGYMKALVAAASGWFGGSSKDYPGYEKMIAALKDEDFDKQVANGLCWAGTPADVKDMIASYTSKVQFEIASLHIKPHTFDAALAAQSLRLFARDVMPQFRDRGA